MLAGCSKKQISKTPEILWIKEYGLTPQEIFEVKINGRIPAPKIPLTIESITKNCIIALGTYDFVLNEKYFDLKKFEPLRLTNKKISTYEMLLEEGVMNKITLFDSTWNGIHAHLMKNSSPHFNAAGMIGWQFFQSHLLFLDMQHKLMGIQKDGTPIENAQPFSISKKPSVENSMLIFKGKLNNRPVTLSLSTENRHTIVNPFFLKNIGAEAKGKYTRLDSLYIENLLFEKITCAIDNNENLPASANDPIDIILGLNELKKFLLIIDFHNYEIGFKPII
jgi:hypothetical protein